MLQIVHRRDVLMALAQAGLVDADVAHAAHVVLGTGLCNVVRDAPPQGFGVGPLMPCGLPDGHPKLLHLWPVKLLQAGQPDYDDSGLLTMRAAASFSR